MTIHLELELPEGLAAFEFPRALDQRLTELLDRQDQGQELTSAEREEAQGLVELARLLSLIRMRADRASS